MKPEINLTAPGTTGTRPMQSLYEWTMRTEGRKPASLTPVQPMPIPPVGGDGLPSDTVSKAEIPFFIDTLNGASAEEVRDRKKYYDDNFGVLFKQGGPKAELEIVYHPDGSEVPPALNTYPSKPGDKRAYREEHYKPGAIRCFNSNGEFTMITMPDTLQRVWAKLFRVIYDTEPKKSKNLIQPIGLGLYKAGKGVSAATSPSRHIAFGSYRASWEMKIDALRHREKIEIGKFQDLAAWAWMELEASWNGGRRGSTGPNASLTYHQSDEKGT